jgi:hypothetical protein
VLRDRERVGRALLLVLAGAATAAVLAHALLLPLGRWYPDEFLQFANHRASGWQAVIERVLGWSPRPISELLLFGYAGAVSLAGLPGVAAVLALAWAGTLLLLGLAARIGRIGPVLPLAILAAALLVSRPGEVFYWPAAALAYLPAFAGLGAAVLLMAAPSRRPAGDAMLCAALVLAAGSVEIGAVAVLALCAAQLARALLGLALPAVAPREPAWVWLLPTAVAAVIIAILLGGRVGSPGEVFAATPLAGDTWLSVQATRSHTARVLGGVPLQPEGRQLLWLGIPVKLAVLVGFWALLPPGQPGGAARLSCALAALALVGAALASIVFAYRQFGLLCCERHETFRQCLVVLAALAAAASLPRGPGTMRRLGLAAMAAAIAGMLALRLPAIRSDLALVPAASDQRAANWLAGRAPGDAMAFRPEPPGRITSGWALSPGTYRRPDRGGHPPELPWHVFAIMLYFDKLELRAQGAGP